MMETVAIMSLHLVGRIPGPSPECPASGLTGSWEAGSGHSCALWHSEDWSPVGKWVRPPWCQPKLPLTFLAAALPPAPAFWGVVSGMVHSQHCKGGVWAWGSAGFLALLPNFQCSSGSTRSSGVGWPGGVCWPGRVGGVQWKTLKQWI